MFLAIMPALHLWPAAEHRQARLAQSAERKALNLVVVGSSPTVGVFHDIHLICMHAQPFTAY